MKSYVKSNVVKLDKVLVVCAGRMSNESKQSTKNILRWLNYNRRKSQFVFIYSKCENLDEGEKLKCLGQMCDALEVDGRFSFELQSLCAGQHKYIQNVSTMGFPRRAKLDDVKDDLQRLNDTVLLFNEEHQPMYVDESWCSIL